MRLSARADLQPRAGLHAEGDMDVSIAEMPAIAAASCSILSSTSELCSISAKMAFVSSAAFAHCPPAAPSAACIGASSVGLLLHDFGVISRVSQLMEGACARCSCPRSLHLRGFFSRSWALSSEHARHRQPCPRCSM